MFLHVHNDIRLLINSLIHLLGFVSNGEYNVLRAKGYTRPLSVLKIKADVRVKYSKMGIKKMTEMISPESINN